MDLDTERRLTTLIYSALLDPSCWQGFLDAAAAEIGGARMQIHGWTDTSGSTFATTTGYDPEMLAIYRHLARSNPWSRTIINAPVGVVLPSQALCPEQKLKKTLFYDEWIRPQENISVGAGVVIGRTRSGPFMFGANIRERDRQEKHPRLIELMGRLAPHLTLAWQLGQAMFEPRIRLVAADAGAASSRAALILLRTDRTIAFADEAAENLLAAGRQCRLDRVGRLVFIDKRAERALSVALQELARSDRQVALKVPRSEGSPAVHLIGLDHDELRDWPLATLLRLPPRIVLCVINHSTTARRTSRLATFGLTRSEQEVAEAIARSEDTATIAMERGVSLATVRSQVKAIYAKCGVHSRAALTALVLGP
ncbi:helix-turn-helix transcriptional regulator [uncultured Jannaschia sp.]|uniref:helix-turn-helix transcriptional regulator n=1 Tax=uncultured Jannaschia sp. TaxID=293347 RepID=UPI00260F4071|nr:helix-turn-helix transcriptional regulator [uncultured Jannaschia sp.]